MRAQAMAEDLGADLLDHAPEALRDELDDLLLADDDPSMLQYASYLLSNLGYTMLTAPDAAEAVRIYEDIYSIIAFAVIDIIMPNLNGRQVLEKMREINPRPQALFMTGHSIVSKEGGVVAKPFSPSELASAVRRAIDEGKPP